MDTIHVVPLDDLKPHTESDDCECRPKIEYVEGGKLVIHHSYDGREFFEKWVSMKQEKVQ